MGIRWDVQKFVLFHEKLEHSDSVQKYLSKNDFTMNTLEIQIDVVIRFYIFLSGEVDFFLLKNYLSQLPLACLQIPFV